MKLRYCLSIILSFVMLSVVVSCKDNEKQIAVAACEIIAETLGYYAAQSPDVDFVLRSIYDEAVNARLEPERVNQILQRLDRNSPIEQSLISGVLRLAEMLGAHVIGGTITEVAEIPPEFINAVARGYVAGYDRFISAKIKRE